MAFLEEDKKKNIGTETSFSRFFLSLSLPCCSRINLYLAFPWSGKIGKTSWIRPIRRGTLGVAKYHNTVRKIAWQITKYRVENGRNTDTASMIGHAYLMLYPSCIFFMSSMPHQSLSLRNWKQAWENVRSIGTTFQKPGYWMSYQFHHRVTVRNCLPNIDLLDRRGQMNRTAMPWRIFFYRIPLARRMKNRIPQG